MRKFKIGDKVKVMKITDDSGVSKEAHDFFVKKYVGKVGHIKALINDMPFSYDVEFKDIMGDLFKEEELGGKSTQLTID